MQKLRELIASHARWSELEILLERIELSRNQDFSLAFENAKSLLESIGKEICSACGQPLTATSSMNGVLKHCFSALGYTNTSMVTQLSTSLANIGQLVGDLRNEIGVTGHGRPIEELRQRNTKIDSFTKDFLFDSIRTIAIFLIQAFEDRHPSHSEAAPLTVRESEYDDCENFNENWDESFGDFEMGDYSFPASMILYHLDPTAYHDERKRFEESEGTQESI